MHVWDSLDENSAIKLQSIEKRMPRLTAAGAEFICSSEKALQGEALFWMRASMSITLPWSPLTIYMLTWKL